MVIIQLGNHHTDWGPGDCQKAARELDDGTLDAREASRGGRGTRIDCLKDNCLAVNRLQRSTAVDTAFLQTPGDRIPQAVRRTVNRGPHIMGRLFNDHLRQTPHMGDEFAHEVIAPLRAVHILQVRLHMTHLTVKPVQLESQSPLNTGCQLTVKHPS